jgi:hypothetical protein
MWNEPNLDIFWRGTDQEFFELYEVVAKKIKEVNPAYKIAAPVTAFLDIDYIDKFLNYMSKHDVPVDIVDYHDYLDDPWLFERGVREVKNVIAKYPAYSDAELSLSEWNLPSRESMWYGRYAANTIFCACHNVETLMLLIRENVAHAQRFRLCDSNFSFPVGMTTISGIFHSNPLRPKPVYYGFKAMDSLSDARIRIESMDDNPKIDLIAGKSKNKVAVVINSWNSGKVKLWLAIKNIPWGSSNYRFYVLNQSTFDSGEGLKLIDKGIKKGEELIFELEIPPWSVCNLVLHKKGYPIVSIQKPKEGYLYIFDREIIPVISRNTVVIGGITVEVDAEDGIDRVEFYIDDVLEEEDSDKPYEWLWEETVVGLRRLKVIAYDNIGNIGIDEIRVFIINIRLKQEINLNKI